MGQRRDRLDKRLARAKATRQRNSLSKAKENNRRDELNLSLLKSGQFPYTPNLMNWASVKLGKKTSRLTESDVASLLK